jgi:CPA2 family monovalent cation:H+ antiporter-2
LPIESSFLLELTIIAGSALTFSLIAWRLRLPTALGQLIAGMIIGPFGLKLITNIETVQVMADIGIVLLLFVVGLELDPFRLREIGVKILVFSTTEIVISFLFGAFLGVLLGWSIQESLFLGGIFGISSTAIIVKLLYERRALNETIGRMMCGALVIEDIFAVLILSLISGFVTGNASLSWSILMLTLRGVVLVIVIFVCGFYLAPRVIDQISQLEVDVDEAGFLFSLSLGFGMAVLSLILGFSAAIGAFLIGLFTLGKRARFMFEKIYPIRDLFIIIFFVSMGMLVDTSLFLNPAIVLPTIVLAFAGKYVGSYVAALLSGQKNLAGDIAASMNPRGEFSLIIAREASLTGFARALIYPIAGTVVLATTLVSTLMQISRHRSKRL